MDQNARINHRPWTVSEVESLRKHARLGANAVALMLGRSIPSVRRAAHRHRISLRKAGERRGVLLGQPRATTWTGQNLDAALLAQMRADVLSGSVDLAELEARVRDHLEERERPLCPSCGLRAQERSSTGLCEPCHLRELARAHRDELDRREARRDLWRARQERSRATRGIDDDT